MLDDSRLIHSAHLMRRVDEELIELIQVLGAYSGLSSRSFDTANPQLDLRLPDGSRLSAVMDVTRRPGEDHFRQAGEVFRPRFQLAPGGDLFTQTLRILGEPLAAPWVLPDAGIGQLLLELV